MASAATVGLTALPVVTLPGTGLDRAVLKFKLCSCCEVLGYQLAPRLGVPVLRSVPVWCPYGWGPIGNQAGEGRIGLAVQCCELFEHVTWEQAALQVPDAVAASLALCLLARDEWVEIAKTESGLMFHDLERVFPAMSPERIEQQTWADVAEEVEYAAELYLNSVCQTQEQIVSFAGQLGLTDRLRIAVTNAATIEADEFKMLFDLGPHPLAEHIATMAANLVVKRFHCAIRLL